MNTKKNIFHSVVYMLYASDVKSAQTQVKFFVGGLYAGRLYQLGQIGWSYPSSISLVLLDKTRYIKSFRNHFDPPYKS